MANTRPGLVLTNSTSNRVSRKLVALPVAVMDEDQSHQMGHLIEESRATTLHLECISGEHFDELDVETPVAVNTPI